jgi:hypothetical protein
MTAFPSESVITLGGIPSLEINGVHGSLENWREILLPLLRVARPVR